LSSIAAEPADAHTAAARAWQGSEAHAGRELGEYVFDLGAAPPIDRLRLALLQANTIAPVQILTREKADDPWRTVYHGVLYRIVQDGQTLRNPDIEIRPTANRYWLLRVDTRGGGLGAANPVMELGWLPVKLVFVARGEPPFQLAYGSAHVAGNGLSLAAIVPGYAQRKQADFVPATLGAPQPLAGDTVLARAVDWKSFSLWTVLVLAVAVLGAMAFRLLRDVGKPP